MKLIARSLVENTFSSENLCGWVVEKKLF